MELYHGKTIEHWKNNAEEDYFTTPISVLKYITVLEEQAKQMEKKQIMIAYMKNLPIEDGVITAVQKAENYYNETFKTK